MRSTHLVVHKIIDLSSNAVFGVIISYTLHHAAELSPINKEHYFFGVLHYKQDTADGIKMIDPPQLSLIVSYVLARMCDGRKYVRIKYYLG